MTRKLLGLPIPVLFVIGCLVSSSSAHAQKSPTPAAAARVDGEKFGPHFNFIFAKNGGAECLTAVNGEFVMLGCSPMNDAKVEVMGGFLPDDQTTHSVLRIKLSLELPFLLLTVALPENFRVPLREPLKVLANPAGVRETPWRITAPDRDGLRSVVAVFEREGVSFCLQRRERPNGIADLVVNDCDGITRWKLVSVPAPLL